MGLQINRHKRFQSLGGLDFVYSHFLCSASFSREICLWMGSSLSHVGVVNANTKKENFVCPQRSSLPMQICIYQPAVALKVKCMVINGGEWLLKLPLCVTSSQPPYWLYNPRLCSQPSHLLSCRRYNIKVAAVLLKVSHTFRLYTFYMVLVLFLAAIFPCWRKRAEENLPGKEPWYEISQIRSQPLYSTYRCLGQEIYMHPNLSR